MISIRRVFNCFILGFLWWSVTASGNSSEAAASPYEAWSEDAGKNGFVGAVLLVSGDETILDKGFGFADLENRHAFTSDTVIDVLSLTKQFTAAAILKLEEQGLLSVNDSLDKFFKDVPEDKRAITIHQLLTHSSGLKGNYKGDYHKVTRDEMEKNILKSWLSAKPGEEYSYSNAGYSLLGIIIEKVSGMDYEQFLHKNLFEPAGMKQTGYKIPDWSNAQLVVGYGENAPGFRGWFARASSWIGVKNRWGTPLEQYWAEDGPWWNLRANGGMLSTLNDLYRWHLALKNHVVLSELSLNKLYAPHFKRNQENETYYGYGWLINKYDDSIHHTGGNPYFYSLFFRHVKSDQLFLFATNDWNSVKSGEINKVLGIMVDGKSE